MWDGFRGLSVNGLWPEASGTNSLEVPAPSGWPLCRTAASDGLSPQADRESNRLSITLMPVLSALKDEGWL